MGAYKIKWLACISLSIMLQKNVLVTRIASKKMQTKCPIRVSICVQSNSDVTDFVFLWSITRRTLDDLPCLYSFSKVILKLSHSARGHFVTLIQSDLHLMTCNLGHKNVVTTEYISQEQLCALNKVNLSCAQSFHPFQQQPVDSALTSLMAKYILHC